jgi:hypothetical protein
LRDNEYEIIPNGVPLGNLQVQKKVDKDRLILILAGKIDESAELRKIDLALYRHIHIDLNGVSMINSAGIREWIRWISTLPSQGLLALTHCPKSFVDQINSFTGFLPPKTKIESVYVQYFCDKCDGVGLQLFTEAHDFEVIRQSKGKALPVKKVICSDCSQDMEFDDNPEKYFKFLLGS